MCRMENELTAEETTDLVDAEREVDWNDDGYDWAN